MKENYSDLLEECFAVFISNHKQAIPLWSQKKGEDEQGLVVWVSTKMYFIRIDFKRNCFQRIIMSYSFNIIKRSA